MACEPSSESRGQPTTPPLHQWPSSYKKEEALVTTTAVLLWTRTHKWPKQGCECASVRFGAALVPGALQAAAAGQRGHPEKARDRVLSGFVRPRPRNGENGERRWHAIIFTAPSSLRCPLSPRRVALARSGGLLPRCWITISASACFSWHRVGSGRRLSGGADMQAQLDRPSIKQIKRKSPQPALRAVPHPAVQLLAHTDTESESAQAGAVLGAV